MARQDWEELSKVTTFSCSCPGRMLRVPGWSVKFMLGEWIGHIQRKDGAARASHRTLSHPSCKCLCLPSQAERKAPARVAFLKLRVLTHATQSHPELHAVVKEQAQANRCTRVRRWAGQEEYLEQPIGSSMDPRTRAPGLMGAEGHTGRKRTVISAAHKKEVVPFLCLPRQCPDGQPCGYHPTFLFKIGSADRLQPLHYS